MTEPEGITIAGRRIGLGQPTYIVAELSANHNQNFEQALALVRAARAAGADAVKLQTYTADTLTIRSDQKWFRIEGGTPWDGETLYDLYGKAHTPWEWQPEIKRIANSLGMQCFSTPFDDTAADFLERMEVPAYKIASFELVDDELLRRVARKGKPVILSTGMAALDELEHAVDTLRAADCKELALLKCTSAYPAGHEEMHLRTIPDMARRFEVPIGLSDHTVGIEVPVAAVTLGACMVEKHLTLSRQNPGPDSAFSLEPQEFKAMVDAVRATERALGDPLYGVNSQEASCRPFRRSLFVVQDMQKGESFTRENVRSIRPAYGLPPQCLGKILGRRAVRNIARGEPLAWELIAAP